MVVTRQLYPTGGRGGLTRRSCHRPPHPPSLPSPYPCRPIDGDDDLMAQKQSSTSPSGRYPCGTGSPLKSQLTVASAFRTDQGLMDPHRPRQVRICFWLAGLALPLYTHTPTAINLRTRFCSPQGSMGPRTAQCCAPVLGAWWEPNSPHRVAFLLYQGRSEAFSL